MTKSLTLLPCQALAAEWFDVSSYDHERMAEEGFTPGSIVYSHNMWMDIKDRDRWRWNKPETHILPDNWEKISKQPLTTPVILDIEHLPITMVWGGAMPGDEKALVARDFLRRVVLEFKSHYPKRKFALYGQLPEATGQSIYYKSKEIAESNQQNFNLAHAVDCTLVVGYLRYDTDAGDAIKRIGKAIKAAREYGKPVGVILWPRYHNVHSNAELRRKEIPAAVMLDVFRAVDEQADFGVLWSGAKDEKKRTIDWADQQWVRAWRAMRLTRTGTRLRRYSTTTCGSGIQNQRVGGRPT